MFPRRHGVLGPDDVHSFGGQVAYRMAVPRRPREHRLETESRVAFERLLPEGWLFREIKPDYGLDGEIEIFDDRGRATGLRFPVQLKATDTNEQPAALSIRLRTDTCLYYRRLASPVLLVRYIAPPTEFFAAWFHELDREPEAESQRTLTFRFRENDRWTVATPNRLREGLGAWHRFHSPALPLPINLAIAWTAAAFGGIPSAEYARRVREAAARTPGLIATREGKPPDALVRLGPARVTIDLGGVASVSYSPAALYSGGRSLATLPFDVLVSVALALEKVGQMQLAARLSSTFAAESLLARDFDVAVRLADILMRDHRVIEALDLADSLDETTKAGGETGPLYFLFGAFRRAESLSEEEAGRYRAYLERRVRDAEASGEAHPIAMAHYNLANFLRGRASMARVFRHYRLAAKHFPAYRGFEYWNREIAGVLYQAGRFIASAAFYQSALDLGSRWPIRGLLADALMFSGQYAAAQQVFHQANGDPQDTTPEWRLKEWALDVMRARCEIDVQRRKVEEAMRLADLGRARNREDERDLLEHALEADLLCALAWFNLGVWEHAEQNQFDAAFCFLMAGLCQNNDIEAWTNALGIAVMHEELLPIAPDIASAAYYFNGDRMITQVTELAQDQPEGFPVAEFVNVIDAALRENSWPEEKPGPDESLAPSAGHEELTLRTFAE